MKQVPINEIVTGLLALLLWAGSIVLFALKISIPDVLAAGDLAVLTFYFSSHSYNKGVENGIELAKGGVT